MMTYDKPIWNRAFYQLIRYAMGHKGLTTAANLDSSIAHSVCATLPVPTVVGSENVDVRPKAIYVGTLAWIMPVDKSHWLALYVPTSIFVSFCNNCFLATPAVAISVRNFVRGMFRGMISHVISPFSTSGRATGLLAQSPWFFY